MKYAPSFPLHLAVAVLFFCIAFPATGQDTSAGSYSISGTVINAVTGSPLDRASISIQMLPDRNAAQTVQTGPDGRFAFDRLQKAKYSLTGSKRGYTTSAYEEHDQYSTAIATGDGLVSSDLVLRLTPHTVISGIILEDSGDPVLNARVSLYRESTETGVSKVRLAGSTNAEDDGSYEFSNVAPGNYFLAVNGRPWYAQGGAPAGLIGGDSPAQDTRTDPFDVVYATTFYPDTTSEDDATPIPIKGGDRIQINFSLHPIPALHLTIRTPTSADNRPNRVQIPMLSEDVFGSTDFTPVNTRYVGRGVTEISVAPGKYHLQLSGQDNGNGRDNTIDVSNDQTVDTSTIGAATVTVTGKLAVLSGGPFPLHSYVSLQAEERQSEVRPIDKDGNFEIPNVSQGRLWLTVTLDNKEFFIGKIAASGAEVHAPWITVGSSPVTLAATVYPDPNLRLDGIAKKQGQPASGAMIVLVPENPSENRFLFRRDQSDSDGTFSLMDVVPGKYTVVAIEDGWSLNWAEPAVIAHYLNGGEKVTVTGQSQQIKLPEPVEVQPK